MDAFDAWFQENDLNSFKQIFLDNGYDELEVVAAIMDDELHEMGGHRKKILLKTLTLGKKMKFSDDSVSCQQPKTQAKALWF